MIAQFPEQIDLLELAALLHVTPGQVAALVDPRHLTELRGRAMVSRDAVGELIAWLVGTRLTNTVPAMIASPFVVSLFR